MLGMPQVNTLDEGHSKKGEKRSGGVGPEGGPRVLAEETKGLAEQHYTVPGAAHRVAPRLIALRLDSRLCRPPVRNAYGFPGSPLKMLSARLCLVSSRCA
jgi:hypothetical protein